jgi:hypothetical protein
MEGKTAATIAFVHAAEAVLASSHDMNEAEQYVLRNRIEMLKDGTSSLFEEETVDEWLEQLRHHHP